jgi:hypothetical protein
VRFLGSAVEVFAQELADHARYGPCAGCSREPALPLPAERAPRMNLDRRPHVNARPRRRARRASSRPRSGGARVFTGAPEEGSS